MPKLARIAAVLVPLALAACERRPPVTHDTSPVAAAPTHPCTLPDDGEITTEIVLDKGCALSPPKPLVVHEGAALRILAGARLTMPQGASIRVKGVLSVKGNDREPATITTAVPKSTYAPYAFWGGISAEGEHAVVELDHASIERAGRDLVSSPCEARYGGVRVVSSTARVSIVDSSIIYAYTQAVFVDAAFRFSAFERNVLEGDGDVAMRLPAATLASIGAENVVHGEKIVVTGKVEATMRWPSFDGPIAPESNLVVVGKAGAPTTLTLARGTTIAMPDETAIVVQENAGLVAKAVRFTSARTPGSYAGNWLGLILRGAPTPTTIEDSTIEFSGNVAKSNPFAKERDYAFHPSIDATDVPSLKIVRTTFRSIYGWAFETSLGDACGKLAAPESGNVIVGSGALCREHGGYVPATEASPLEAVKSYVLRLSQLETNKGLAE